MHKHTLVAFALLSLVLAPAGAHELTGYVSGEGRFFFNDPLFPEQEEHNASIAAQPEYYHEWENGSVFTFTPFARVDSADSERTHWDIRELNFLYPSDSWFFRFGVSRVFWGATEFVHLVDVVNQIDFVEDIDEEEKLGQPMVQFGIAEDWGTLDLFVLPGIRERTFPGADGRLRPELVVDTDNAIFEDDMETRTISIAVRYGRTIGSLDLGVFLFGGTNRDPLLIPSDTGLIPPDMLDPNELNGPVFIPFYEDVIQFGADATWVVGDWIWKLEALYRDGFLDPYFAGVGGFEYTFIRLGDSKMDLGLLAEYAYDDRGEDVTSISPYENDLFLGFRWTPNDPATTMVLAGFMQDLDDPENVLRIEASRRFGDHWRLIFDAWFFLNIPQESLLYSFREDDFVRLELAYYF